MKRTPLALAISLCLSPALSHAQALEEVIVTAQKMDETLTSAPVAVSVVSGQEITDFAVFQGDELNKLVTGMEVRYEGDSNAGVGLRGVGTFQTQSAPARVGTYMDDYYMASQAGFALASLFDMSNVQILKGPQGTLYGQPSPTGALILTSRDPDFDGVNGYVQGSYTNPEGYNVQAAVNVPLIDDQLAMRVAVLSDDRESGIENIVRNLDDKRNRDGVRAKLLWQPTDTFTAKLGYTYMETENSDTYRVLETVDFSLPDVNYNLKADDRKAIADAPDEVTSKQDKFGTVKLDWDVADMHVSWFSGMLQSDLNTLGDQDNTDLPISTIKLQTKYGDSISDSAQHEMRVSGSAFDFWDWTVGGYYAKATSQTDVVVAQAIPNQGVFPFSLNIPIDTKTSAIFTHNTITLAENTELTVGVRYNKFEQDAGNIQSGDFWFGSVILPGGEITEPTFIFENAFPCYDGQQAPCVLGSNYSEEEWTGTIKLAHFFSDAFNLYGTLDRGYRPGAPNFDTTGVFTPDLNTYSGEKVNSVEIGAKGDLFEGRARYTAAIFYSVYEDYQAPVNFEAYNTIAGEVEIITNAPFVNVDEAVQQGIEADFKMLLTDNWSVYTGFTYTNVEFTDGALPCTDPGQPPVGPDNRYNTCDADGEKASAQPEWTGVLQSEYTWPGLVGSSDMYVNALWSYRGEVEVPGDTTNRLKSDSFSTLDLYTGLRNDAWSLQLFAKNVLDDDGVFSKRPVGQGYNELTVVSPQTFGVMASYNF
ncbi:MAG: TonB-dependent receptor [Gammaproteobacteria bacterium]|nr:TonB-dependent receptor [Gammaproteobacteria bacterium]